MNETISTKYGVSPESVEKSTLDLKNGEFNGEMYNFQRIKKVDNNIYRTKKYETKKTNDGKNYATLFILMKKFLSWLKG